MSKVPVYDKEGTVIGLVTPNSKLDTWDGHNWCSGNGRHEGYSRLKRSGKYVLIRTSQWAGEQPSADIISQEDLIRLAASKGCLETLLTDYPELTDLSNSILDTD